MSRPELRPYQLEALAAIEQAATAGTRRVLVSLPTGTGKTVVFTEAIRRRKGRALVIAHRDELLGQAAAKLVAAGVPARLVGRVQAGRDDVGARVVLASAQTLARSARRERVVRACETAGAFSTIVVDEAHHAVAASYRAILDDLAGPEALVVGVTATPARAGLDKVLGAPIFERDLVDMIGEGWLCDLRGRRIDLAVKLDRVGTSHGDYVMRDLAAALKRAKAPTLVARSYVEHGEDRPALVFVPSVALAHETAASLRRVKVAAEALDGSTPVNERAAILERFRTGETAAVVNCGVLTEGVDLPHVACVVVARPTLSPLLYAQMVGRGTRLAPGKADCLVLDLAGASAVHDLGNLGWARSARSQSLGDLVGLHLDEGASVLDAAVVEEARAVAEAEAAGRREQDRRTQLARRERLLASDVALLGRRAIHWTEVPGPVRTFTLSLGNYGHVVITGEPGGGWSAFRLHREDAESFGTGLALDQATALAEREARRYKASSLVSTAAPWRSLPASEKQLTFLARVRGMGESDLAGMTRGAASDLLDVAIATDRLASARKRGVLA